MNDYKPASRTAALGAAALALAMTAITIGFAVVAPAKLDSGFRFHALALEALQPSSVQAAPLAAAPMRIEVVAVRYGALAPAQAHTSAPKRKHGSGSGARKAIAAPERVG